jgi:hypothetical protein
MFSRQRAESCTWAPCPCKPFAAFLGASFSRAEAFSRLAFRKLPAQLLDLVVLAGSHLTDELLHREGERLANLDEFVGRRVVPAIRRANPNLVAMAFTTDGS